jgi:hypothetical protein
LNGKSAKPVYRSCRKRAKFESLSVFQLATATRSPQKSSQNLQITAIISDKR